MRIKFSLIIFPLVLCALFCAKKPSYTGASDPSTQQIPKRSEIRIREFPIAVQCWTFRKYSFFESLEKIRSLGISSVQAFPGQILDRGKDEVRFDHALSDEVIQAIKTRLDDLGMSLVAYGVVELENGEEGMRPVFEFARKFSIPLLVAEPGLDDYSALERLVKEYGIRVAIHNHPAPSTYSKPEVVLSRIRNIDPRIGVCGDTGHWMRTGIRPVDALRLLEGRILDMHLKDLDAFGLKEAKDVPFCSGQADIRAILEELVRQNYRGYLTVEYENEAEADNPSPSILRGIEAVKSITHYK